MKFGKIGSENPDSPAPAWKVVRLDPRFDRLVAKDATPEKVAEGFTWVEGPAWSRDGHYLLFSDIPGNAIYKWQEKTGVEPFLKPSGYTGSAPFTGREPGSNGLAFDPQGRLVICQHGDRRLVRIENDGSQKVLADRYQGKRLNSPNDLVFKKNGDLYFTDPPFGLPKTFDDPDKELDFNGVYRLRPDGQLTLLTREIRVPNGIALSADEKILYISNSDPNQAVWLAYDVLDDGTIANQRVFFDATSWSKGPPDGMKVDREGNIFATGAGGIHVFSPAGEHLGSLEHSAFVSNCTFGNNGADLYITASTAVYRLRLTAR
jgi:gluconolactonase